MGFHEIAGLWKEMPAPAFLISKKGVDDEISDEGCWDWYAYYHPFDYGIWL